MGPWAPLATVWWPMVAVVSFGPLARTSGWLLSQRGDASHAAARRSDTKSQRGTPNRLYLQGGGCETTTMTPGKMHSRHHRALENSEGHNK